MASTSALSALSKPSSRTSKPIVRTSDHSTIGIGKNVSGVLRRNAFQVSNVVTSGFSSRVDQRNHENEDDDRQREPLRDFQRNVTFRVQVLDQELTPNPRDNDEGAVDDRRIFLDQRE